MKVLYNWLKEFVDFTATPDELHTRLSLAGIAVDAVEDSSAGPVLDLDLPTNRGDCLGHYGVAREVAALYRLNLRSVRPKLAEAGEEKVGRIAAVEIQCPELCGRYTARVIRGVNVGPSPDWLQARLAALGQAAINNVVDATNYAMFELGQPLHAFDLDTLAERRIVVRRARPKEKLRTLDDTERTLTPEMCMIADPAHSVAIGGVMGGAETEISLFSRSVLLESAWFDPISIRRTAKMLGLRTEASIRFERGADSEMAELASRRCAELIQQLAGGEILAGVVDCYPRRAEPQKLELTRKELRRVLGADVADAEMEAILGVLGFEPIGVDAARGSAGSLMAAWECRRPSWRGDVTREIDLVEEVARHYGFEKFPARLPTAKQPAARLPHAEAEDCLRERLVALGYHEIVTIPLVDPEKDAIFHPGGLRPVQLANPLAGDASLLRTSGLVNMLQAVEWNLNRGQRNLRLFEFGRAYGLRGAEPIETRILTLGATGLAREKGLHEEAREYSFADLKGELDLLGELVGGLRWESGGPAWLEPAFSARLCLEGVSLSPGSQHRDGKNDLGVAGRASGVPVGFVGRLARRVAERFKLRQEVFVAELRLDSLYAAYLACQARRRYQPLARFPAVSRDFSLILADTTTFAQVAEVVRALAIPEVVNIHAVDLFRGGEIPPGKHSLLIRVSFQSHQATFTEAQLTEFTTRIIAALQQQLGAIPRVG
jgi:phenylalanyl-tRNA synthetase beta chain